jgi:hypothetical protein
MDEITKKAPTSAVSAPAEPLGELYRSHWGFWRARKTSTGRLCIVAPWYLLLRRKLKFTLFELWLFIAAWSVSIGIIATEFKASKLPWFAGLVLAYVSFHIHCYGFTFILHLLSCSRGLFQERTSQRLSNILAFQIAALLLCGLLAICLRGLW